MTPPTVFPAVPRWAVVALLAVVVLGVGVQYVLKTTEPDPDHPDQPNSRSAFLRWKQQLHALGRGENIYEVYTYPNAPIMALILYPLAQMPRVEVAGRDVDTGALTWFAIKVVLTVVTFAMAVQVLQERRRPFPAGAQLAMLVLSLRPIIGDLSHGNVNLLILFLVVAALYAFKRGFDFTAGVVLALGICCKVTPALFVPYFLWKRAWKTAAGCGVGLVLFFVVVPGAVLGMGRNAELLASWTDKMIRPFVAGGEVTTEHNNQSIPGLLYRMLTHSPSFKDEDDQPVEYYNLVALPPDLVRLLLKGLGLGFLALMCWSCRTPITDRDNRRLGLEFSLVVLGMLLFSERTWKHHCVTLLLPFGALCYSLAVARPTPLRRWYGIATLVLAVALMTTTSTSLWDKPFGFRLGAKLAQVYGAYVWAELALLAAVVVWLADGLPARRRRIGGWTPGASGGEWRDGDAGPLHLRRQPAPQPDR
jgi:hypothetical protein